MKIALLSHLHFPIGEPFAGGLEAHTHMLATALTARGHEVLVYAAPGSGPGFAVREVPQIDFSEAPGPRFVQRGEKTYHRICDEVALGDFDIVHNNSLHYIPMLRAHELGAPMVQVMHTPFFWELAQGALAAKRNDSIRFISVSEATGENWSAHVDAWTTIPNGIDLSRWTYNAQPKLDRVIYSGRIVPEKGVHLAIDAARLAQRQIVLAGPIRDSGYFDAEISPRLGCNARYLGHLSLGQLVEEVRQSTCSVFSSVWPEPFGYILAESLACGTPVAGFRVGAVEEVLSPETGVLANVGDVAELALAIREACALDRRVCHEYARGRFSLGTMVDAYERVYREEVRARRHLGSVASGKAGVSARR